MRQLKGLNRRAAKTLRDCIARSDELGIDFQTSGSTTIVDFGVDSPGGLEAGRRLAEICLADLGRVQIESPNAESTMPRVTVQTDHPIIACLQSQYAGWKIATDDYFGMGSGPFRAAFAREVIFQEFPVQEDETECVGVLEAGGLPTESAIESITSSLSNSTALTLAVAPTASQAGNIQVVARSVETAMHKLHEIHFPLELVRSGYGSAPLPPVAENDLEGIGRTNDSILYGAAVNLWVECEDSTIEEFGPLTPSNSSVSHGENFLTLFKKANYDFYELDKSLFSPAVVVFHNLKTGRSFRYGTLKPDLLQESFGLSR